MEKPRATLLVMNKKQNLNIPPELKKMKSALAFAGKRF